MSVSNSQAGEAIADLNRRIAEAENCSTAAANALGALARTDADTIQAKQMLWEEMDALRGLREQFCELQKLEGA